MHARTHTHTHTHCKTMWTYCRHIYIVPQLTKHIFTLTDCSHWETNKPYKLSSFMGININGLQGERCVCVCVCVRVWERSEEHVLRWVAVVSVCVSLSFSVYICVCVCVFACMYAYVCPRGTDHRRQAHQGPLTKHWLISRSHNGWISVAERRVCELEKLRWPPLLQFS